MRKHLDARSGRMRGSDACDDAARRVPAGRAALLVLSLLVLPCVAASPPARSVQGAEDGGPATNATDAGDGGQARRLGPAEEAPTTPPRAPGGPSAIAPAAAPASEAEANLPTFDEDLACRRRHCYGPATKPCFDNCYRHGHPTDPQGHERCDQSCRDRFDIPACEQACARDRRAFTPLPGKAPAPCGGQLRECRKGRVSESPATCELQCLERLQRCEALKHAAPKKK